MDETVKYDNIGCGIIVLLEHGQYTMMHSRWKEKHPEYGKRCSLITVNSSESFWLSADCIKEQAVICMKKDYTGSQFSFQLPALTTALSITTESENYTQKVVKHGRFHFIRFFKIYAKTIFITLFIYLELNYPVSIIFNGF